MKTYLAGSINSGRQFLDGLKLICKTLEELGAEVLSKNFVVDLDPEDWGETRNQEKIVERDLKRIEDADFFVAEVSQGSHGVGYEHRYAEGRGIPVFLLRHASLSGEEWRSAFLGGTKAKYGKVRFAYYDEGSLRGTLEGFLREFFPETVEGKVVRERQR